MEFSKGISSFMLAGSLLLSSGNAISDNYAEHNTERSSWFYSQAKKVEKKFKDWVEDSINEAFEKGALTLLGESLANTFGKKILSSLSGLISVGPFISFDGMISLTGSSGEARLARKIEIMTRLILDAIDASKEEIINSVEQQFQDETMARLNTIIRDYGIYNSRSEEGRKSDYRLLQNLISDANYVLERMEIKTDKSLENLHSYMNIASIQMLMQREYTHWLYINEINPNATEEEIQEETQKILKTQLDYVVTYITESAVGDIEYWRNDFRSQFPTYDTVTGYADSREYDAPMDEPNWRFFISRDSLYNTGWQGYAHYYSYPMGDGRIRIGTILHSIFEGDIQLPNHPDSYACNYYDAAGKLIATENKSVTWIATKDPKTLCIPRAEDIKTAIDRHREDEDSFEHYIIDGYLPVQQMIDTWWDMTGNQRSRRLSSVDNYVYSAAQKYSDLSVNIQDVENGKGKIRINNFGQADTGRVILRFSANGKFFITGLELDDGTLIQLPYTCTSQSQCILPILNAESQFHVLFSYGSSTTTFNASVKSSTKELGMENNYASEEI
ncbi:hypothetical protein [Alloalcanivorax xenomutans]|uniref:hypothetical protein n=1 Tax=Alloalcanivorax xenomutans TaxID=1094342 RepID=UPI003BABFD1E